jgi:prepilin-type N-terminal cleavage/methylation domain-containing protein
MIRTQTITGFTLIELLVVLFMVAVFMAAVFSLYQTHQRSAYTQEETVEVQQNLRVGMEQITNDIRMSGFLVTSSTNAINTVGDSAGIAGTDENGVAVVTDTILLNTASAAATVARNTSATQDVVLAAGGAVSLSVNSIETLGVGDTVVIVGAQDDTLVIPTTFTVTLANNTGGPACAGFAAPCLTLTAVTAGTGSIKPGDLVVRTGIGPYPNNILYQLVTNAVNPNCPLGQNCLQRTANDGTGAQIIATNITNLQFMYLLENGTEVAVPIDLSQIRGVRTTLTARRVNTTAFTDNFAQPKTLVSEASIRNQSRRN